MLNAIIHDAQDELWCSSSVYRFILTSVIFIILNFMYEIISIMSH